jgi:hypothetical protein
MHSTITSKLKIGIKSSFHSFNYNYKESAIAQFRELHDKCADNLEAI